MKIIVVADVDDFHWHGEPGKADVTISCGDVTDGYILQLAEAHDCSKIYAVKGNHDSSAPFSDPIIDLHLKTFEYSGITFGGLNGSWKYKPRGNYLYEQWEVKQFLDEFPRVDIFVSHNSPRGLHDKDDEVHYGFEALNDYISRAHPAFLIHGHQHINQETKIDNTRVIGVYGHRIINI